MRAAACLVERNVHTAKLTNRPHPPIGPRSECLIFERAGVQTSSPSLSSSISELSLGERFDILMESGGVRNFRWGKMKFLFADPRGDIWRIVIPRTVTADRREIVD